MENVVKSTAVKRKQNVRKLTALGMLGAISLILVATVHFPIIPAAPFLEYDPADVPILIGTFAFGPVAGFLLTVVVSIIQGMTVSAASGGPIGIIMHIFATGSCVLIAGNIYRRNKTRKNSSHRPHRRRADYDRRNGTDEPGTDTYFLGHIHGRSNPHAAARYHSFQPD